MTSPVDRLIARLERRDNLSADEKETLTNSVGRLRLVSAKDDIVREGNRPSESSLLVDGFAARYKVLAEGGRQITAIHVPGDFVDLHSFLLKTMDHGVAALSDCKLAMVPHCTLAKITEHKPHLTRLLWLLTLIDSATHREWLTMMGRSSATTHMAHLICELFCRLQAVGLTEGEAYLCPLTQQELGDTLGLSNVHVNRVLKELRTRNLVSWRNGLVTIHNWNGLQEFAEFSPAYLNVQHEPR
ncbi:Crp/Fnr family transcriptional regulator [Flaviflagellibacter deserti]|uniref:Crp/Fnr family transcriptional regulator n=1 Tax=Flaviflagellibacter deserti TaxID=2267266 RepID=A0ABV9Z1J0_9HYPH